MKLCLKELQAYVKGMKWSVCARLNSHYNETETLPSIRFGLRCS